MCFAMYSASLPTPGRTSDDTAYWKSSPTKYRPGSPTTTPRSCKGRPSSPKMGRSIQGNSSLNPVHQITFDTSRTRPSSSVGRPPPYADGPRHLLDSGSGEVLNLDADERRAMGDEPRSDFPPDGRPQCQHVMANEPYHGEEEPRRSGSVTDGDLSRGLAREVCRMRTGHLESDLRPRVASTHHQNGAFLELRGATVLARMELHDARLELLGESRDLGDLVGPRRDDHMPRCETTVA